MCAILIRLVANRDRGPVVPIPSVRFELDVRGDRLVAGARTAPASLQEIAAGFVVVEMGELRRSPTGNLRFARQRGRPSCRQRQRARPRGTRVFVIGARTRPRSLRAA